MVVYDFNTKMFPYEYLIVGIICLVLLALALLMLICTIGLIKKKSETSKSGIIFSIIGFLVTSMILLFAGNYEIDGLNSLSVMKSSMNNGNYEVVEGEIEHCEIVGSGGYFFKAPPTNYSFSVNGKQFFTDNGQRKGKCFVTSEQEKYLKVGTRVRIKYVYYNSISMLGGDDRGDYVNNGEEVDEIYPNDNHNEILYLEVLG